MNITTLSLTDFLSGHVAETKVLICPNRSVGHALAEAAGERSAWFNLHVHTLGSLAADIVENSMLEKRVPVQSGALRFMLLKILRDRRGDLKYFVGTEPSMGYADAFAGTLSEFQKARLETGSVSAGDFVTADKAHDFLLILDDYLLALSSAELMDASAVIRRAIECVHEDTSHLWKEAKFILMPELEISALEKQFIDALAQGNEHVLDHAHRLKELPADNRWACRLYGRKPVKTSAAEIEIRRAGGYENEVADAFRCMLRWGIQADQVEIVLASEDPYLALIRQAGSRYELGTKDGKKPGITFGNGVPLRQSSAGKAMSGLLNWMRHDFRESLLRELLQSGLIRPKKELGVGGASAARILRRAKIGWERARYLPRLKELEQETIGRSKRPDSEIKDRDPADYRKEQKELAERTAKFGVWIDDLLKGLPEMDKPLSIADFAAALSSAVQLCFPTDTPERRNGRQTLLNALEELALVKSPPEDAGRLSRDIEAQLGELRVSASGPKPGAVHVSSVHSGGCSGREFLWVMGMDEAHFPRVGLQDPILLDRERSRLSSLMPIQRNAPVEDRLRLRGLVAGHHGKVIVSFSSVDLGEGRILSPSSAVLDCYRMSPTHANASFAEMEKNIPEPAGFVEQLDPASPPHTPDDVLTETEVWLTLADQKGSAVHPVVESLYPPLAQGAHALAMRLDPNPTQYDGILSNPGSELTIARPSPTPIPGKKAILSASSIDTFAECPYRYFQEKVLEVKSPDELEFDPERWLNALDFGSLVHGILQRSVMELRKTGRVLKSPDDLLEIQRIAEEEIAALLVEVPIPNQTAFENQKEDLSHLLVMFLQVESRPSKPLDPGACETEVPFGLKNQHGTPIGTETPVSLLLPDGRHLFLRGKIDRIDRQTSGKYEVWDYKSGSTYKYDGPEAFLRGRNLQHVIYKAVAEILVGAVVAESGYFFPGAKGAGLRISTVTDSNYSDLAETLLVLANISERGQFLPTMHSGDCKYCDYKSVCGDVATITKTAELKMETLDARPMLEEL